MKKIKFEDYIFTEDGIKHKDIAQLFGINKDIVTSINIGRSWKDV